MFLKDAVVIKTSEQIKWEEQQVHKTKHTGYNNWTQTREGCDWQQFVKST
jgi:hypothetical protein